MFRTAIVAGGRGWAMKSRSREHNGTFAPTFLAEVASARRKPWIMRPTGHGIFHQLPITQSNSMITPSVPLGKSPLELLG